MVSDPAVEVLGGLWSCAQRLFFVEEPDIIFLPGRAQNKDYFFLTIMVVNVNRSKSDAS